MPALLAIDCKKELDEVRTNFTNTSPESRIKIFKEIATCFEGTNNKVGWLETHIEIQFLLRNYLSFDDAIIYLDSIMLAFGEPISYEERRILVWAHLQNGYNHGEEGKVKNYYKALNHYQKAIELIAKDCSDPNYWECYPKTSIANYIMHNSARIYLDIREFEAILDEIPNSFLESLKKEEKLRSDDIVDLYIDKGIAALALNKFSDAKDYFNIAAGFPNVSPKLNYIIHLNLGNLYRLERGKHFFKSSLNSLNRAEEDIGKFREIDHGDIEFRKNKISLYKALTYRDSQKFDLAINELEKPLGKTSSQNEINKPLNRRLNANYLLRAQLNDSLGNYEKAVVDYNRVIQILYPEFRPNKLEALSSSKRLPPEQELVDAFVGKINYWYRKAEKTKDKKLYANILLSHKLAIAVEDEMRKIYSQESSRLRLASERNNRMGTALEACYKLWDAERVDSAMEYAFYFIEKNKAQELQSNLVERYLAQQLPDSTQRLQIALRAAESGIYDIERKIDSISRSLPKDTSLLEKLNRTLSDRKGQLKIAQIELKNAIAGLSIDYESLHGDSSFTTIAMLQRKLKRGEVFLSLFDSEENLYLLYATRDNKEFHKIPLSSSLKDQITFLKAAIKKRELSTLEKRKYQEFAYSLYAQIFLPVEDWNLSKLTISTCNSLYELPFEVLLHQPVIARNSKSYSRWDYLWKKFEISYTYSGHLYKNKVAQLSQEPAFEYLGFAPKYVNEQNSIAGEIRNLKGNRFEVLSVNSLYSKLKKKHHVYLDFDAHKSAFRSVAQHARIFHLAVHALSDTSSQLPPYLLFGPPSDTLKKPVDNHSNRFYLYEAALTGFMSELVVMSACNSAIGPYMTGEGIYNFGRAFRLGGVPNIIMSLWNVDDAAPRDIIPYFFQALQEGNSIASALNEGRLAYLTDQGRPDLRKSPYYWAHFVHYGDAETLYSKKSNFFKRDGNGWANKKELMDYLLGGLFLLGSLILLGVIIRNLYSLISLKS